MIKRTLPALLLLTLCSAFTAHARVQAPIDPPAESYCAECGMYVRGEGIRFASEIIFKDGETVFFCDLGDLFLYYEVLKKKDEIAAVYVKDYLSGAWVDGRRASYLAEAKVVTPMRYGILSFSDRAGAENFRKEKGGGTVYSFDEVLASRVYRR